jgi:hypothetical protein
MGEERVGGRKIGGDHDREKRLIRASLTLFFRKMPFR